MPSTRQITPFTRLLASLALVYLKTKRTERIVLQHSKHEIKISVRAAQADKTQFTKEVRKYQMHDRTVKTIDDAECLA